MCYLLHTVHNTNNCHLSYHSSGLLVYATPLNPLDGFLYMQGSLFSHVVGFYGYNTAFGSKYHVEDYDSSCPYTRAVANIFHRWGMLPLLWFFLGLSEQTITIHRDCYNQPSQLWLLSSCSQHRWAERHAPKISNATYTSPHPSVPPTVHPSIFPN